MCMNTPVYNGEVNYSDNSWNQKSSEIHEMFHFVVVQSQ